MKTKIHLVDVYVGNRLRTIRKKHHLSQTDLSEVIDVSHQQIHQYELGVNRISASTLYDLSKIFHVPISYFYAGLEHSIMNENHHVDEIIYGKRILPLNILLVGDSVDDEISTKNAISKCEEKTNIYAVHDGMEALEFLRNKKHINSFPRPDIVIMDIDIPKKNGHEVLKDIKSDRELLDIPVIILTNIIKTHEMLSAYQEGASGFLIKSLDENELNKDFQKLISYWYSVVLPSMQNINNA